MTRAANPDDICAYCDEFSVKQAAPEMAELGMGRCRKHFEGSHGLDIHVGWNSRTCVSFRLDRVNIAARRQYVQVQRINQKPESPP
jgi:hypothetical protein